MFDRLESIKNNGTATYTNIVNQIPLDDWIHKAMTNVHLHRLLRYQSDEAKNLHDKITMFLTSKVKYPTKPKQADLLVYRRNGESHLVKDYSFDHLGGLEEGLTAAIAAGAEIFPSLKAAISEQPQPAGDDKEFGPLCTHNEASIVAGIVSHVMVQYKRSGKAAKAAAVEAAMSIGKSHPQIFQGRQKARIAGSTAGQRVLQQLLAQGIAEEEVKIRKMFDEEEACDMLELLAPNLLHEFQRAMFDFKQLETLNLRDKSAAVLLR